jgi:putative ABC transport system permease protein
MRFMREFLALVSMSLSGLPQRAVPALTIVIGVMCAVGVLVSMLAMGTGAKRQELGDVRADRVVVTSLGARGFDGSIPRDEATAAESLPYIRKDRDGRPIVVLEALVPTRGRRRVTGTQVFVPLVGTGGQLAEVEPELRITAGRMFRRGLHELIASTVCAREFTDFGLGERRSLRGFDWTVVGLFEAGESRQCTVFGDVDSLMSAFDRNDYTRVVARLASPADFPAFSAAVHADPALHLEAHRESELLEEAFAPLNGMLNFVSYFVGAIMAIGATLGSVNALYSIVDARRRELATLRAIGFGPAAVVVATLCESVLLAVPGALLGCAIAWALFHDMSVSPFGYSFQLAVTLPLAVSGVAWALWMGLLGGLLPALRAARVPVTTALRAT